MRSLSRRAACSAGAVRVLARLRTVSVGQNLLLQNGVLSGTAPFSVAGLPQMGAVTATDVVAVSRAGRDAGVAVGQLLAGLAVVPGLDLSQQVVRSAAGIPRRLVDWLGDALEVEAFGAVGDGETDDTPAFDLAVASGKPVRLGAKTYVLNGQWTVNRAALLLGIPGATVLKRERQAGGAWISAGGPSFGAIGVIFDAGSIAGDSWGVLVGPGCEQTLFEDCAFLNARGPSLGCGLVIQARDGTTGSPSRHVVRHCEAAGNAVHGIWVQAACGAVLEGCLAHDNGAYGLCLDFNDPAFTNLVRHGEVRVAEPGRTSAASRSAITTRQTWNRRGGGMPIPTPLVWWYVPTDVTTTLPMGSRYLALACR